MKEKQLLAPIGSSVDRRSFLKGGLLAGGAAVVGAGLLTNGTLASAQESGSLNTGDIAILRFLAAAELIEADLWTQYAELGGIGANLPVEVDPNQTPNNYQLALSNLDGDATQYITSNWKDELTHAAFLNAYLESRGAEPVNFDEFETLPGSTATGSTGIGRLTNLMNLNVDTSWYVRYRSATNPDLGATFPQAITLNGVTAIPRTDADFGTIDPTFNVPGNAQIQAIANVAAFHFGYIEQGGSSLYGSLIQKATDLEVSFLRCGLELDDTSAGAHTSLAFATYYWNWDPVTAEREYKRALELNPNLVQGHHWYATFLLTAGRFPEALDQIEQARKLDPASTTIQADKGWILFHAGRASEAFALLKQLESTDPTLATTNVYLTEIYFERKDYANFFAESKRSAQLRHDEDALAVANAAERGFAAGGLLGMRQAMLPVQKRIFDRGAAPAYGLAATYALLGKNEDALRYLQMAYEKREIGLLYLPFNPDFNSLHDDSEYKKIAEHVRKKLVANPQP
jgi:tetratricopeptide (TPR) repeat protein